MNSCILMAEVVSEPQLRYTPDNQTPITEMQVEFPGSRPEDPPARLKVVGWGNLAQEIQERYHPGDRVIIEGRLTMSTIERQEGFKEKRAELTAQRIHSLGAGAGLTSAAASMSSGVSTSSMGTSEVNKRSSAANKAGTVSEAKPRTPSKKTAVAPVADTNYDDIPF